MSKAVQQAQVSCFGKLVTRGDFVKSSANAPLLSILDSWASQAMEMLVQEARWKQFYDEVPPIDFAFLGTRSRVAIGGHLRMSGDSSGRRFPFMAAAPIEVDRPSEFLARSPLALSRIWQRLNVLVAELLAASDSSELLQTLNTSHVSVDAAAGSYDAVMHDFMEIQTIGSLERLLREAGHEVSVQRTVLALGMLLQPVMASGATHLDKGLRLPLPLDPMYRPLVAAFWMEMIVRFLARSEFELVLFVEGQREKPTMVVSFDGAAPEALHSLLDPAVDAERNILITDPEWVRSHAEADYGIAKLNSYLAQPKLSLRAAMETFREVFIGN